MRIHSVSTTRCLHSPRTPLCIAHPDSPQPATSRRHAAACGRSSRCADAIGHRIARGDGIQPSHSGVPSDDLERNRRCLCTALPAPFLLLLQPPRHSPSPADIACAERPRLLFAARSASSPSGRGRAESSVLSPRQAVPPRRDRPLTRQLAQTRGGAFPADRSGVCRSQRPAEEAGV